MHVLREGKRGAAIDPLTLMFHSLLSSACPTEPGQECKSKDGVDATGTNVIFLFDLCDSF